MTVKQALGSRYELEERISHGGMGEIWRGWDLDADQQVAIKVLHARFAADPTELTRFVRERTILTGLNHPNLVLVRDMIMEGSRLALVMDLVEGPDMHRYLRARGPLAPEFAATLIAQVCEGLAAVHAAGIVHRDLKPSNILLDTSQSPPIARLSDFGIARAEDALPLTAHQVIVGTPEYCAPEVIAGEPGGPAIDVYAVGTSLYQLLAGEPPFAGGPVSAVFWRHVDAEPLRPPGMPEPLWAVIAACLAKDPAQRPTAESAARLLRDCLPAVRGAPPIVSIPADATRFRLTPPMATSEDERSVQLVPPEPEWKDLPEPEPPHPADLASLGPPEAAGLARSAKPAGTGPEPGRRWRPRISRLRLAVGSVTAVAILVALWLAPPDHRAAPRMTAAPSASPLSSARIPPRQSPTPGITSRPQVGEPRASKKPHASQPRHARPTPSAAALSPSAPALSPLSGPQSVGAAAPRPAGSVTPQSPPAPTASPAPASPASAPPVSQLLYSFEDGTPDGWQAGTNVASVSAVSGFLDGPGKPYDGNYALDATEVNGAGISSTRTMSVTPASPLNLSAAQDFFVAVDGYGFSPYATGYTATITLASGNVELIGSASVQPNTWTKLVLPISSWAGRGQITSISVSYVGVGSDIPWNMHFQIDDAGYTT